MTAKLLDSRWGPRALALALGILAMVLLPSEWLFVPKRADVATAETLKRYACPMLCTIRSTPGACPVCGMEMTEIRDTDGGLPLSAYEQKMIGLRTAKAEFRTLWRTIRSVGRVEYDETRVRQVAAWVDGRVDRLYADYTGYVVKHGDPLFGIYSPILYESQQGFLSALQAEKEAEGARVKAMHRRNVASTRKRLELFGFSKKQIDHIAESGELHTHLDVPAPIGGTVVDKKIVEGQYVKQGQALAVVADLSRLWVKIDIFEEDYSWIVVGQHVDVATKARPLGDFHGTITFLDPTLNEATRSVGARVEVVNDKGELRPGMFAEVSMRVPLDYHGRPLRTGHEIPENLPKVLAVPEDAVLVSGTRHLVYVMVQPSRYVENDDGTSEEVSSAIFEGREVGVGPLADGWWPILSGLKPDDVVATRGNFLIDSQLQLAGKASLIRIPPASDHDAHAGHGGR